MKTRRIQSGTLVLAHAALLTGCGGETGDELGSVAQRAAAKDEIPVVHNLRQAFPDARMQMRGSRVRRVFGTVLATGNTADQAAQRARQAFGGALKAGRDDLQPVEGHNGLVRARNDVKPMGLMRDQDTGEYKFWLYRYGQRVKGIPVHDAELRVLVRNRPGYPVVWAGSTLRNVAQFSPPNLPATLRIDRGRSERALAARGLLGASTRAAALDRIGSPELVVFAGDGEQVVRPRLAVRYTGEDTLSRGEWHFVADVDAGDVLHVASRSQTANVLGRVRGNATVSGSAAAECAPSVTVPLPYAEVGISGGSSGFAGRFGYFSLPNSGTDPVDVASTIQGRYFDVFNIPYDGTTEETLAQTVTPPGPAGFLHNAADTEGEVRAQVNAYVHVNRARDFLLSYLPEYHGVSAQEDYTVYVNGDFFSFPWMCPANAVHYPEYLVFCAPGSGAVNTAIPSVIYHEYGHEIIEEGGSGQGYYGEGMADTISFLITGESRMAVGVANDDCESFWRDADNDCQYDPTDCSTNCGGLMDSPHLCGRVLSGIMWDIREALKASDPTGYRDVINTLVLSSIPEHEGIDIDATIATDLLTLDDDDEDLDNGTPHSAEICAGFEAHGIDCPIAATSPCSGLCENPVSFGWTDDYQSGALGTAAVCRETTQAVAGGNCGNLASGRKLYVNGTEMTCNNLNWPSVPAARNGGYCVTTTPGDYAWAFFTLW